jgi:hypothetical protein
MFSSTQATAARKKVFWTRGLLQVDDPYGIQLPQWHKIQLDTGIASMVDMTR